MRDSRLTHWRECLVEAVRGCEDSTLWLIRRTHNGLVEMGWEGGRSSIDLHDRVDMAQAQQYLAAAADRVRDAARLMDMAIAELKAMEDRA